MKSELRDAGREDTPAQSHDRRVQSRREPDSRRDHAKVEQYGGEGRDQEVIPGIQYRTRQGRQADERQIGKGDPEQLSAQLELRRLIVKARGEQPDQGRGGDHAQGCQHTDNQRKATGDIRQESIQGFGVPAFTETG